MSSSTPSAADKPRVPPVGGAADQSRAFAVVQSIEPWSFDTLEGKVIQTASYRLYTTEKDALIVDRAPRFLELALARYRTALTPAGSPLPIPSQRLETFLLDNRTQWRRLTLRMLGANGQALGSIDRGGFAIGGRAFLFDLGPFDTLAVAAHEGWHQYTQRAFRDQLPPWLEEGIATYMEGHKWQGASPVFLPWANIERFDQLRQAKAQGSLRPLRELLSATTERILARTPDDAVTHYAQVWALTHFLADESQGRSDALAGVLHDAAAGRLRARVNSWAMRQPNRPTDWGDAVFRACFDEDLAAAELAFTHYQDVVTNPGARDAIAQGLPPPGASESAKQR